MIRHGFILKGSLRPDQKDTVMSFLFLLSAINKNDAFSCIPRLECTKCGQGSMLSCTIYIVATFIL